MPKKNIGVRLDEETIRKLEIKGKASTVIREIVLESFNPKPPKIINRKVEVIKEVIKEIHVEIPTYIDTIKHPDWTIFNREIIRDIIKEERDDGMPKWYISDRIRTFIETYGVEFE